MFGHSRTPSVSLYTNIYKDYKYRKWDSQDLSEISLYIKIAALNQMFGWTGAMLPSVDYVWVESH